MSSIDQLCVRFCTDTTPTMPLEVHTNLARQSFFYNSTVSKLKETAREALVQLDIWWIFPISEARKKLISQIFYFPWHQTERTIPVVLNRRLFLCSEHYTKAVLTITPFLCLVPLFYLLKYKYSKLETTISVVQQYTLHTNKACSLQEGKILFYSIFQHLDPSEIIFKAFPFRVHIIRR